MTNEEIDRVLSRSPNIIPSDNFLGAVMGRLEAPPPLAFPWKRALPGLAAWVGVLIWFLDACIFPSGASQVPVSLAMIYAYIVTAAETVEAGWLSFALLLSLLSVALSLWITGKRASVVNVWGRF